MPSMRTYLSLWAGALAVVALLASSGASPAAAATPAPRTPFTALPSALVIDEEGDEVFETEEGPANAAECAAEAQEEIAEGEPRKRIAKKKTKPTSPKPAKRRNRALVRSTAATVSTTAAGDAVHLSLQYKDWTPATVAIAYSSAATKDLELGKTTKHFGKKGTIKLTASLSDAEAERALAAQEFDIAVKPANSPGFCGKIASPSSLDAHKALGRGRVWTD